MKRPSTVYSPDEYSAFEKSVRELVYNGCMKDSEAKYCLDTFSVSKEILAAVQLRVDSIRKNTLQFKLKDEIINRFEESSLRN